MKFVWLLLEIFTFYLNCLDSVVLVHPFWVLSISPVCSSVLSCWTNRTSSKPPSSTFLHSLRFATDIPCSHGPEYADVSPVNPLSYVWSYHYFSRRKQIQMSSMILPLLPIRIFQHPQYVGVYANNINKAEEQFQMPALCRSLTSAFPPQACPEHQNPLLVTLFCIMISGLRSFSSHMHVSPWCCDERRMTALFLAGTCNTNARSLVKPNIEE